MPNFVKDIILNSNLKSRGKKDLLTRKRVQKRLINLYKKTTDTSNYHSLDCNMLRDVIRFYPNKDNFHSSDLNDASDFLEYLLNIFDIKKIKILQNGKIKYKSVIHEVNVLPDLNQSISHSITKFFRFSKVIEGDYLIFRINRYFDDDIFYKTRIYPVSKFKLGKEKLELKSVVVFSNFHYTCYFLCEDEWYYYDDARIVDEEGGRIEYIGGFNEFLKSIPSPLSQGVLYFYEK
jgi:hypothetical protein